MAAEKKNLFDLDAFDKECRFGGSFVAALPSGVLSIHIKQVKKLDENHVTIPDPEVYVRVRVGKFIKCSQTTTVYKGRTIIDNIKHFSLTVSRKREDPSNEVRIDLIVVESNNVHRIVGHKDMHLYDIIKNLYVAGTYELKYRQHTIAEVELEACFAYGIFGFGYSHQLENRQKKLSDILSHSLLLRVEPPENRRQANSDVMTPMPVGHPEIINFAEEVEIGHASADIRDSRSNLDVFAGMEKHQPVILARTMRKRLHRIQTDFAEQSGRLQRKKFLDKLIMNHVEAEQPQETEEDDDIMEEFPSSSVPSGRQSARPGSAPKQTTSDLLAAPTDTYGDDDDYAASMTDVAEIGNFLQNAPGIVRRTLPRMMPSVTTISEDDDDNDDGSSSDIVGSLTNSRITDDNAATADTDSDHDEDRRRSTLVELPSMLVRGFAGRLLSWRSTRARQTPEVHAEPPVILEEGPSTSSFTPPQSAPAVPKAVAAFRNRVNAMAKKNRP